jgi:hypothetical protein
MIGTTAGTPTGSATIAITPLLPNTRPKTRMIGKGEADLHAPWPPDMPVGIRRLFSPSVSPLGTREYKRGNQAVPSFASFSVSSRKRASLDISQQVEENWYLEMEKGRFLRHNCVVQA